MGRGGRARSASYEDTQESARLGASRRANERRQPRINVQGSGRWSGAEELGVQVLNSRKRVLGEEYPDTLTSMNNLTHTLKDQEHSEAAHELLSDCATLSARAVGTKHPFAKDRSRVLGEWTGQRG